jgi:chromosome segregation ATPase
VDLIITFLAAMSGALVGGSVGVYLLFPRLRLNRAELDAVRGKLQENESSLKTATATIEGLRKQNKEQEQTIRQGGEILKEKQKQLETELAQRAAAEHRVQELAKNATMKEEAAAEGDAQAKEANDRAAEELRRRLASYEVQLGAAERQIQQIAEEAEGATTESAELRHRCEQEAADRAALEEQLSSERKQAQAFAVRITELENELVRIGQQLGEERQSAANRMELLLKAQENLSHLVQAAGGTGTVNGNGDGSKWPASSAHAETGGSATQARPSEAEPVAALN